MSKFKEGDWVREYGDGKPIKLDGGHFRGISKMNEHWFKGLVAWQPEIDEWCWFWNDGDLRPPKMSKFYTIEHGGFTEGLEFWNYDNCEPFEGTLPTYYEDI